MWDAEVAQLLVSPEFKEDIESAMEKAHISLLTIDETITGS
ncbi:MAG: hypothetical protein V7746_10820 [Halioglobus sp.]